ncbi:hypothetical protein ACJMK2_006941 [Sinanodonta woodiana]|uniref:Uncharacterized protein n=1 Tax=Sinanodonta woodiana TaxID=1069815 RepID=A0ABD3VXJ4_SINWO
MEMLAADIVPETALQVLIGLGLKSANNWSLRAAGRRTTLLLVWDAEDTKDKGRLEYRRGRGKKQPRRENRPMADTPSPLTFNSCRGKPGGSNREPICTRDNITSSTREDRITIQPNPGSFLQGNGGSGHVSYIIRS